MPCHIRRSKEGKSERVREWCQALQAAKKTNLVKKDEDLEDAEHDTEGSQLLEESEFLFFILIIVTIISLKRGGGSEKKEKKG